MVNFVSIIFTYAMIIILFHLLEHISFGISTYFFSYFLNSCVRTLCQLIFRLNSVLQIISNAIYLPRVYHILKFEKIIYSVILQQQKRKRKNKNGIKHKTVI